jgi:hypothetical protein
MEVTSAMTRHAATSDDSGSGVKRHARPAPACDATKPTRTRGRAAIDEVVWERQMIRLRRVGLVLGAALAAIVARMVIDGPELLAGLTGALIPVLLVCSLVLRRQGHRLRPGASSQTTRGDPR